MKRLNIEPHNDFLEKDDFRLNSRKIRQYLREDQFEKWSKYPQKGKGVVLFRECPFANKWIRHHKGLTVSEWIDSLKMVANVAAVRAIPGRSPDNNRCRHCHSETETLAHVLGYCRFGETLRNTRHHKIRSLIANNLKENKFEVHEEVHGLEENGSTRRIDIIAIQNSTGTIFDPTIRFETDINQPQEINKEKIKIYENTIPYYKTKYNLKKIEIIGLMIGARGTLPNFTNNVLSKFKVKKSTKEEIIRTTLKYSVYILRNHLYNNNNKL